MCIVIKSVGPTLSNAALGLIADTSVLCTLLPGLGAIQVLRNADGGGGPGGCQIFRKNRYEGVVSTLLALRVGGWGSNFQEKTLCNT